MQVLPPHPEKYDGEKRGSIRIETCQDEGLVQVIIKDDGNGIPEVKMNQIFNPFFTKKKPGEGTGLGLSVTRSIIMMHKGFIKIESEKGKGTKATVAVKVAGGADGGEKKNLDHR